jgi:hypothetical protein
MEALGVVELYREMNPRFFKFLGQEITKSIPAGSIYFGGSDEGRFLPTLFSESQMDGRPFFTITQNQLADGTYLNYVGEIYPIDWMYPYLTPHQFIFKLNREPLSTMPPQLILSNRRLWTKQTDAWLGPWLRTNTPLAEVMDFIERVYRRKELKSFQGDPDFVKDRETQKAFGRMRAAVGGLYVARLQHEKRGGSPANGFGSGVRISPGRGHRSSQPGRRGPIRQASCRHRQTRRRAAPGPVGHCD